MEMDHILAQIKQTIPDIQIKRLEVTHPADDDFLWFITGDGLNGELQIESCEGDGPFRIEYDWSTSGWTIPKAEDVVSMVQSLIDKRRKATQPTTG